MISLEQMAEKESKAEMCTFKQAHAMQYDECYICDGYNYNCDSYELQNLAKEEQEFQKELKKSEKPKKEKLQSSNND